MNDKQVCSEQEYKRMADDLKKSLLFRMSLGSKELFHSNVWAWLIEQDPAFIKVFFPEFDDKCYQYLGVSRECWHRDVIIWLEDCDNKKRYYYVIENKIKSLQDKEQLKRYTEDKDGNTLLGGVFTGIINALKTNELRLPKKETGEEVPWEFVDYGTIAKRIREQARRSARVTALHFLQIDEYCQIIESINGMIQYELDKRKDQFDYSSLSYKKGENHEAEYLEDLRIKDIYTKLKGADILRALEASLKDSVSAAPQGYRLETNQSFHNGKVTLDIRYTNREEGREEKDYLTIGIQLEEYQFRLMVERNGTHKKEELFNEFCNGWFDANFDEKAKKRALFKNDSSENETSMKQKYDSYGGNGHGSVFVYQYFNIVKEKRKYNVVFDEIKKYLQKAREIIESRCFA